jgi:site-specific DNA recombinase
VGAFRCLLAGHWTLPRYLAKLGYMDTYATGPATRLSRILAIMSDETGPDPATLMDIYRRKSVEVAGRRGQLSVNAQEAKGRDWASWNGLQVRRVWTDILSASKDVRRPDYDSALLALANGEVKTLWCYKLDRFNRKGALAVLTALENLKDARIIFGEDGLDSSNADHRRMIMWKAEDAREESARISQRVTDTNAYQRDRGQWVSGNIAYGLVLDPETHKLVPDLSPAVPGDPQGLTKADVARRVFMEAVAGKTLRGVTRSLEEDAIPSPGGASRWNQNSVHRMLHNPVYSGWQIRKVGPGAGIIHMTADGKRVRVGDGLVPENVRLEAAQTLAGHRKPPGSGGAHKGKPSNLLTGITQCAGCGRSMPVMSRSYACLSSQGGKPCPAPASAFKPALEAYVVSRWKARLVAAEPEDRLLTAIARRWSALLSPETTEESEAARGQLRAAEAALERLLRDRRDGRYEGPASRYYEPLWQESMAALKAAQEEVQKHEGAETDISFLTDSQTLSDTWDDADTDLKRDLIRLAIDNVKVTKAVTHGAFDGFARTQIRWVDGETD